MGRFSVQFYEKSNGETPVEDFLLSLDDKMRAKMVGLLEILQDHGNISRVLYFFYVDGKIIITNGFIKKTQKTPSVEITLAKRYRADYIERYGEK